jgi:carboxypeptidase Taq
MRDNEVKTAAYDQLVATHLRLHRYEHLASLAGWDRAALMPPKGNEARAAALAEIGALIHRIYTDPAVGDCIARAADEPLDELQRANLREMRREWRAAAALPTELIERKALVTARCEHAWRKQRPANDWPGFVANFRAVLDVAREEAARLADASGLSRYDALLDRFEPGMRTATLERLFGELRGWLPALIAEVVDAQAGERVVAPAGPFPREAQRALSLETMRRLGFDFEAGRLDESTHPFTGGVPEDVRMTTRYRDDDVIDALMSTIHETGHARYEQNLPRELLGQPLAEARSFGIHESCSLAFEMQLARSRAFCELLAPMLVTHFGAQAAFEPDNLYRLLTRVERGRIRVDADETTYPAHVILRYEIERPLIEGEIEPEDIPALWDDKMQELLGLDTRGDFKDGPLQDVHWSEGALGYFPCYTLGAMMAAQWFEAMRAATPDLDARIARGELNRVFDWLRDHVWSAASRYDTDELLQRATGRVLDAGCLRRHLERRYLG